MKPFTLRLLIGILSWIPATTLTSMTEFTRHKLVEDGAEHWWARAHADINGDGWLDFYVINKNSGGGWLGWFETVPGKASKRHIIAEAGPDGGTFAGGDTAAGDIDGDGDIDVLGPVSPGEWGGAGKPTTLYWYENPGWQAHLIGEFPNFVKDFDLVDLNADGRLDVVGTCFVSHRLLVFRQDSPTDWSKVADIHVPTLHEGQHVGDLDGDGDIDVVSTAFWFENPGADMTSAWTVRNIDPYWNSDTNTKSWAYNSTKIICDDIDKDGRDEVVISCSERYRTRVAWYDLDPADKEKWTRHEIGLNNFSHTLQVGDVDLDGDLDVLSGNNGDQGDSHYSPVILFSNEDGLGKQWKASTLDLNGAYNSYLGDFEGDGDLDFFRYPGHAGQFYELWENQTVNK